MFMKRLLFIYNPHAGKELLKPKLADVIDIFVKAGYEVVAYPTQAYRDAYKRLKNMIQTNMIWSCAAEETERLMKL